MEVTSGSVWRAGEPVKLPSGNVARLVKPEILSLAADPDAPDLLIGLVMDGLKKKKSPAIPEITPKNLPDLMKMFNSICRACFRQPRIVEDPKTDDEISIRDVSDFDKIYVFGWAFGMEGEIARSFRPQPGGDVGTVPGGDEISAAAQPDDGHPAK